MSSTQASALAIIYEPALDKVLCVTNRRYGGWGLPGGRVEEGESPKHALIRELQEELGVVVYPGYLSLIFRVPGTVEVQTLMHVFHVRHLVGDPHAAERGTELAWMSHEGLGASRPFGAFHKEHFPDGYRYLQRTIMVSAG